MPIGIISDQTVNSADTRSAAMNTRNCMALSRSLVTEGIFLGRVVD